ncbi:MAG: hypothetical protein DI538_09530 [Azospira oryzae]|jgi:hypothetical protein|nr:MAG: hypothetical protein DI538_09530 [Azospira oryzae]
MNSGNSTFRVRELIGNSNATLPAFGQIIFEAAKLYVERRQSITIDFTDVHQLTESFIRSSIGKLVSIHPEETHLVKVTGLVKKEWETDIKNAIKHELNPYEAAFSQQRLKDIFI